MTDEFLGPHVPGILKMLFRQLLKSKLLGHVIEDAMGNLSGVGNRAVKIKKKHPCSGVLRDAGRTDLDKVRLSLMSGRGVGHLSWSKKLEGGSLGNQGGELRG